MKINLKKTCNSVFKPVAATAGSAGVDLTAIELVSKKGWLFPLYTYRTGIHIEIPKGYVGLLFPRSSISDTKLMLANAVGVIDSDFRGEITMKFRGLPFCKAYEAGNRIGQLIVIRKNQIDFTIVGSLSETERGSGGYGSTGI